MRVLIAPDKFKGSLSAQEVCTHLAAGIRDRYPHADIVVSPLADGGEGSLDTVENALTNIKRKYVHTVNAAGDPLTTYYLHDGNQAWIEMAKASGWTSLAPYQRLPMNLSTFGTGVLVADAITEGFTEITIFCGGSATVDGGLGIAMAVGYQFRDDKGTLLKAQASSLDKINQLAKPIRLELKGIRFFMAVDVFNPLTGPHGAAVVYGPQKGANPEQCLQLDLGLKHLRRVWEKYLGQDPGDVPGAGAAGGLGAAGIAFLGANIVSGAQYLMSLCSLEEKIKSADLVVTGEGKLDHQSLAGKLVWQIYQLTTASNKPLIIVCGTNTVQEVSLQASVMSLTGMGYSSEQAIRHAPQLIYAIGQNIGAGLA